MKKGRKKKPMADCFLELLEESYPEGISTAMAAQKLYGSASQKNRTKIYRLARALREMNYVVYGHDGLYKLAHDDPDFLFAISQKRGKNTVGAIYSQVRLLVDTYQANPEPELLDALDELRLKLAEEFSRAAGTLKKYA